MISLNTMNKTVFAYILSFVGFVLAPKTIAVTLYIVDEHYCTKANWVILTGVLATNLVYILALDLIVRIKQDKIRYASYATLALPLVLEVLACVGFSYDCNDGTFIWWSCLSGLVIASHICSMVLNIVFS